MIRFWTRFAWTGDPNGEGLPPWPRFEAADAKPKFQVLGSGPTGVGPSAETAAEHQCEFWATFIE